MVNGRSHTDLTWHTSLACNGGECIKVATGGQEIYIADSKKPLGPVLTYSHKEWRDFVTGVKNGDFDDLV
jgi:hypothetical protein